MALIVVNIRSMETWHCNCSELLQFYILFFISQLSSHCIYKYILISFQVSTSSILKNLLFITKWKNIIFFPLRSNKYPVVELIYIAVPNKSIVVKMKILGNHSRLFRKAYLFSTLFYPFLSHEI